MAKKNIKFEISRRIKFLSLGFTLFESIIYIAIVSIFLVSVSYLVIDLLGSQTKSTAQADVLYYQDFIIDQLGRDIRRAYDITALTDKTLVLALPGADVSYNFDVINQALTRQIDGIFSGALYADNFLVSGFFSDQSFNDRAKIVGVALTVTPLNSGGRQDFFATSTIIMSFELRGRR